MINNQNLITGTETKEDETTIGMQINCASIDVLAESHIRHSSCIIEEEENDTTTIGMQLNCNNDTATENTTRNNNNNERLIVGISTDIGKQAQTTQNKKRK